MIDFATCEIDNIDSSTVQLIKVFTKFEKRDLNDLLKPDFEYSIYDGVINVGRFYPLDLSSDLMTSDPSDRAMLEVRVPGRPSTLYWDRKQGPPSLQPGEVKIEVYAIGINFRVNR